LASLSSSAVLAIAEGDHRWSLCESWQAGL
jgi:hypothetical protein